MSVPEPRKVISAFRCQGLSLQQGVLDLIQAHLRKEYRLRAKQIRSSSSSSSPPSSISSQLSSLPSLLLNELVSKVKAAVMEHSSSLSLVNTDLLQQTISSIRSRAAPRSADLVQHLSALTTLPRFSFDPHKRVFVAQPTAPPLCAAVSHKALVFVHRYELIHQRVLSNPLFSSAASGFRLSTLDTLHGTSYKHNVLGMLTRGGDGRYALEDVTGSVAVTWGEDFVYGEGFYMEGCIVLAEGRMDDERTLSLDTVMMPPTERRRDTLTRHRELRLIEDSLDDSLDAQHADALADDEPSASRGRRESSAGGPAESDMVLVLSEVWLDQPTVIARLRSVFAAFDEGQPPSIIVLAGSFLSASSPASALSTHLDVLGELIASYPRLNERCQFVLIPAASDTPFGPVLPYPAMLSSSHTLSAKVKNVVLTSNPHHLLYHRQHLLFYRQNTLALMQRHALLTPAAAATTTLSTKSVTSEHRHYLHTLLSQSHLSPFTLDTAPVYWQYDTALSLYPLPHVLFLLDSCAPFEVESDGCLCVNPGSFGRDGDFSVYYPHSGKTEPSKVA